MARQRRNIAGGSSGTVTGNTGHKSNKPSGSHSTPQTPTAGGTSTQGKSKSASKHNNDANSSQSSSGGVSTSSSSTTSSATGKGKAAHKKTSFKLPSNSILDKWKTIIGCVCLAVASYFCYIGYLETRVNTPFDNQKMVLRTGLDVPDLYWGSYRPLTYFGMKTRDPRSPVMGLMWYTPSNLGHRGKGIRHWCEQGDNLNSYGWTHHDGRSFGVQEIHDSPFELRTSFVKDTKGKENGGEWTARISVRNISKAWDRTISLIWYVALDERSVGHIHYLPDKTGGVYGDVSGLGEFQLGFNPIKGRILHLSHLSTVAHSLSKLTETVFSHFRVFTDKHNNRFVGLPGEMISQNGGAAAEPNFIAVQFTAEVDFSIDITYKQATSIFEHGELPTPLTGRAYTSKLQEKITEFDQRFEKTFHLGEKGYSPDEIKFAKHALSNMVGSIGYFYGASRVQSVYTKNPVPYWKAPLYTAVPSRSFFPRGFLWDEGFHGLLISSWDLDIELDILCHWFDLMNVEGWIPREQILGVEALAKVPEAFVTQHNTNANPPTFLLTIRKILRHHDKELKEKRRIQVLERLYPRLQAWFSWFNTTQRGAELGAYRWRGRDANNELELNPKTLTSGLDDFPRASHPTEQERHVDLRCWIGFAAEVMSELSTLLDKDPRKYFETYEYLDDNERLNEQHLSPHTETYSDWGLHTDFAVLKRPQVTQKNSQRYQQQQLDMVRVVLKQPELRFVDSTFGYVNLFPFLIESLKVDAPSLGKILDEIRNPDSLWTKYGLRSLSKSSPLYMKRNTEHDPPYWRGPIWININYLVLRALRHYGTQKGPHAAQAREIYNELRENVITNIYKEYKRTGYIWEQYDDTTGHGKGSHPFTGWSALVVLMMAEQY